LVLDEAQRGKWSSDRYYDPHKAHLRSVDTEPGSSIDDEYAKVGLYDPKIVITTSRDPSSRLLQFSKVSLRAQGY